MNAARFVSRLTRKSRSNFFYAFLLLPRAQREAIFAVYAFCRLVDDATDVELARFTLTLSVKETGAVLALLRRSPHSSATSGWVLHAVGEGVPITVPTQGLAKLTRFVT